MLFCVKTPINKLYVFGLALLLAVTLAGCSGSKDTKAETPDPSIVTPDPDPDPGPTPEEIAAMTAAALTKAEAINQEALGSATLPFHSAAIDENYTVTAERQDGAVTVKIAIPGAAMDDPEFMRADALPAIEDWDGSMYALGPNDDGETEIVGVYTDIAAPDPTDFGSVYTLNVSTNTDNDDPQVTNEALRVTTANLSKIMSAGFSAPSEAVAVLTFYEDDAGTENIDEAAEVMGTYDSLPGTYRCAESPVCTVNIDAEGELTAISNGWAFIPAPGPTVDVPDADYLYYGFWVKKTEKDGATTYNAVQTFAGARGIDAYRREDMLQVRGNASYEGGAAGVYVKNSLASDGEIDTATSGTFKADVSLMANFGGEDVAVNKQYSIEGSASNFVLSGGEENAWSVNLKADFGSTNNEFTGTADGGGAEAAWNATFYGAPAENTPDGRAKVAPPSLAGEFNVNFLNGHAAGAFGAHRQ